MASTQIRTQLNKGLVPRIIVTAHLTALIICVAFIYLAWDGGQVIRQAMDTKAVAVYSPEVYRAVYHHYFRNTAEPGWAPLSVFIGVSNVVNLYILAPMALLVTTFALSRKTSNRWKWWVVGFSVLVDILLLWQAPSLRYLATILD